MEPHILAFPFPIPGHMNCLMHCCRRLATDCGFKITFISNKDNYKLMVQTRDIDGNMGSKISIVVLRVPTSSNKSSSNPSENLETPISEARAMQSPLEQLIRKLQEEGTPAACILTDTFNGWVQDVANLFQLPRAVLWTSNAVNDIIHLAVPELISKGFVPVSARKTDEPITFMPGIPSLPPTDLPLSFYFDHPILECIADGARRFSEAEYALVNTFEELEQDIVNAFRKEVKPSYYPVGFCISPAFFRPNKLLERSEEVLSEEDRKCLSWLDTQRDSSVIYVSFGSVATMSVEQFQDLAIGLEKSNQPFVLVLRKTLVSDPAVYKFFEEYRERTSDRGLVVSWAPQMHVLLHPSVGGFLTHCGWNSTTEGISAGLPMLAWPCMAEQNVNCKELVLRWKIAIEVKEDNEDGEYVGGRVSEKVVTKLVNKLMVGEEGKEMRKRAVELREATKRAASEDGSSVRNLKAFAAVIRERMSLSTN